MKTESTQPQRNSSVLVTGAAGFIGFHLSKSLLEKGLSVFGVDNLNDYYDVRLKKARLEILQKYNLFSFHRFDLANREKVENLFDQNNFSSVVHLAAQAGVRYSLTNPYAYLQSNFVGFFNIIETSKQVKIPHLLYASSSSVYGLNTKMPFSVHDNVDHPVSFYAASKKSNELVAHAYSHLFGLPTTGLRFFTVYGPWGRPDMALFKFCRSILLDEPLTLYNYGDMSRDFTYVDDIIEGVQLAMNHPPIPNPNWSGKTLDPGSSPSPYRIYNIGAGKLVKLRKFLELIEEHMGKKGIVELAGMQPGDVQATSADISDLSEETGYKPETPVEEGIPRFVKWFLEYYGASEDIPKM